MQLYIVRHADSNFVTGSDHQRPLSELGKRQALQTATFLKHNIQSRDAQIICSDALRTQTTALIIQQQLSASQLSAENAFYHAHVGQWCDAIMAHQTTAHLILVGHNPTISLLSRHLNPSQAKRFSPSCVAHYELEIKSDGLKLPAQLKDFFIPNAI